MLPYDLKKSNYHPTNQRTIQHMVTAWYGVIYDGPGQVVLVSWGPSQSGPIVSNWRGRSSLLRYQAISQLKKILAYLVFLLALREAFWSFWSLEYIIANHMTYIYPFIHSNFKWPKTENKLFSFMSGSWLARDSAVSANLSRVFIGYLVPRGDHMLSGSLICGVKVGFFQIIR